MIDFVGAGPGDKELITVKGKALLEKADVIVYAGSLVNPELLSYAKRGCEIYDSAKMTLEETSDVMINAHRAGKRVVRLHTGDPAIYGAIGEQMEVLDRENIGYGYCPGVSSLFGAASAVKKEFTVPGKSQSVIITRAAGRTEVPEKESIESFARHGSAMAIFLSSGMADKVSEELIKGGYSADTPAAIVYKATWEDEKVVYATVGTLPEKMSENGIRKTALMLVGDFLKGAEERSKLYDPGFSTEYRLSDADKDKDRDKGE